ncbi:MAG: hypothetical protein J6V24_09615, partial [Clostridia bacterium]|nr:hypothetical protein [Clostridia bacterium]
IPNPQGTAAQTKENNKRAQEKKNVNLRFAQGSSRGAGVFILFFPLSIPVSFTCIPPRGMV